MPATKRCNTGAFKLVSSEHCGITKCQTTRCVKRCNTGAFKLISSEHVRHHQVSGYAHQTTRGIPTYVTHSVRQTLTTLTLTLWACLTLVTHAQTLTRRAKLQGLEAHQPITLDDGWGIPIALVQRLYKLVQSSEEEQFRKVKVKSEKQKQI